MQKVNVNDLNGQAESKLKLITKTIQEANPIKFSELCTEIMPTVFSEACISYNVMATTMQTPMGTVLVYVAIMQYMATEEEFKRHLEEIKRNNLLIKP